MNMESLEESDIYQYQMDVLMDKVDADSRFINNKSVINDQAAINNMRINQSYDMLLDFANKNNKISKICGLMYGSAIGDALGQYYESSTKSYIKNKYPDGIQGFCKSINDWTDDTDHLILTMETLKATGMKCIDRNIFAAKLTRWKETGFAELGDKFGAGIGSLTASIVNCDKYVTDPHARAKEIYIKRNRKPAPNGALMRASIIGVLDDWRKNIIDLTLCTHCDSRCVASSVVLVDLAHRILQCDFDISKYNDDIIIDIFRQAYDILDEGLHTEEFKKYEKIMFNPDVDEALVLLDLGNDQAIGWGYVLKCLGAVVYAFRKLRDLLADDMKPRLAFKQVILNIINEGGDTDTNAAVAGSIIGAAIGYNNLYRPWLAPLQHKVWLDKKIIDTFAASRFISNYK